VLAGVSAWSALCASVSQVWAELGADDDSPLRVLMREQYLSSVRRISSVFDAAVTREEVEPFETTQAAMALIAVLDGALLQAIVLGEGAVRKLASERFRDWCCEIVPPLRTRRRSRSC
jgi:uncharacterized membrane protein